ncbi:acylphosphatase [Ekhidna sp.]|uniref:acylphosphatase n=1 Tax=Ekhidna sp. TaxID=2608089 RepID=UPI00329A6E70
MKCYRIHVRGRVQGVFFRVSTKEKAIALGLNGWVRNQPDGSVLIEVEGPEGKVNELIEWCSVGPPASNVEDVDIEEHISQGFMDFKITH